MNEFERIQQIKQRLGNSSHRVLVGIGDDAAVCSPPLGKLIATVDMLVEGSHFEFSYLRSFELGHKALAVSLSDIAAMGAEPLYALFSLGLTDEEPEGFLDDFYEGAKVLSEKFSVDIIGGNLTRSKGACIVDVTVIGQTDRSVPLRSGAKVGDKIVVTGTLGGAAAGLHCIRQWGRKAAEKDFPKLITSHVCPTPRINEGILLASSASALIDISDGLSSELHHLMKDSAVGIWIEESQIPVSEETRRAAKLLNQNVYDWVWNGGEDYELLACTEKGPSLGTIIGEVRPFEEGLRCRSVSGDTVEIKAGGWDHFRVK